MIERKSLIFTTGQEMIEYGKALFDLCNEKRYGDVLARAFPEPEIEVEPMTASDLEGYLFYRLVSLAMVSMDRGKHFQLLDITTAMQHYQEAAQYIDEYISCFGSFVSNVPLFNECMVDHRVLVFEKSGEVASACARLILKLNMLEHERQIAKGLLISSIDSRKISLSYMQESPNFQKEKFLLVKGKSNLFHEYCTLMFLFSSEAEKVPLLKEAKKIHKDFEKQSRSDPEVVPFFQNTSRTLIFLEKMGEKESLSKRKKSRKPGKIAAAMEKKEKQLDFEITKNLKESRGYGEEKELSADDTQLEHQNFCAFAQIVDSQSSDIATALKRIEEKIRNQLEALNKPSELVNVYETYASVVGVENFVRDITVYGLAPFLLSGELEEALKRINIISDLEYKQQKNNSNLTRFLQAAIKSLNGDYQEWAALEEEMEEFYDKEKEKRKRKKERQRQKKREAYVEAIKQSQEISEKIQALVSSKDNQTPYSQGLTLNPKESAANVRDAGGYSIKSPFVLPALPSQKEAKEEKAKRHAAAQKQRKVEKAPSSHSSQNPTVELYPLKAGQAEEKGKAEGPSLSLSAIGQSFSLKGVAKTVDEEIEQGTWRFSRENVMAYFEALGCAAKEGGKHQKISLPKAIMIYQGRNLISIINDLGGALTLPRWDGSEGNKTVPFYLRKQILKAREKLLLFRGARAAD